MSEDFLSADIRKKLREFELQVQFTCPACRGRASDASAGSVSSCLGILGPSGCGKSMTLKSIAGIVEPDSGSIILDGRELFNSSRKVNLKPQKRRVGYLFQNYALFPNMTVEENILTGLKAGKRYGEAQQKKRVSEMMERFRLSGLEKRYPAQLSGGQQQRIAIARALATNPKVLLCDEATSALDPSTTHSILQLIRDINRKLGITCIIITHQMSVVEEICNHVAILDGGQVAEEGAVGTVFSSPKSQAARRLVFPQGEDELVSNPGTEARIRVIFNGAKAAGTPLIATMASEKHILVNILSASTRSIEDRAYGSMLLGVPGGENVVKETIAYLSSVPDVIVEEV